MVQRCKHLGLAFEPGKPIGILCQSDRKNLYRDIAVEVGVPRSIHFSHSAGADWREDLVGAEFGAHRKRHIQ